MGVNSLPKTVTRQRRNCDLNPGPSAPGSSTPATRLPMHRCTRGVIVNSPLHCCTSGGVESAGERHQGVRLAATHAPDRTSRVHQALPRRHRAARVEPRQPLQSTLPGDPQAGTSGPRPAGKLPPAYKYACRRRRFFNFYRATTLC